MNKKEKINEILIELADILKQFSDEKQNISSSASENTTNILSAFVKEYMDDNARRKDFLAKNNELVQTLKKFNIERENALEKYALKLYSLYDDLKIEYFENALNQQRLAIEKAKLKEFITTEEFELLFNYSAGAQKGFRSRLNNPIPFIQKGSKSKILYRTSETLKWLKGKRR